MARPRATRHTPTARIGEYVNCGEPVGNGHFEVNGTVFYGTEGTTKFTLGLGTTVSGKVNIVKLTYGRGGLEWAVTVDGKLVYVDGEATVFRTLAEAAKWAGV